MNDDSTPREVAVSNSAPSADPSTGGLPKSVRSDELLHGQRELLIIHEHEVYRLRVTRNGKLILTK
jgi:hemin uptake protein HemP